MRGTSAYRLIVWLIIDWTNVQCFTVSTGAGPGNLSTSSKWSRSAFNDLNPSTDALAFQQMDVDHYIDNPVPAFEKFKGPTPITRMFGVTMGGQSVLCHVHGFRPYFYVEAPPGFREDQLNKFMVRNSRSKAIFDEFDQTELMIENCSTGVSE